jgi:sugar-specific transcriptional regulator TrmB
LLEPFFSELKVLTDLGLSVTSARVYTTLVKHDSLELSALAKMAHIARPDVYRTLEKLQELGLIEKILEHPTRYRAIPKKEALSLLLDAKTEKYREVEKETQFLIETADTKEAHTIDLLPKPKFVFVSPGKGLINKIKTAIDKAQFSVYSVLSWKRFSQGILNRFPESLEKAVARKVDMRFIVEAPPKSKTVKELIEFCSGKYGLQMRCVPDKPKTYFSIFDRKEILIVAISQSGFKSSPVLWSNSSALVALGLDHFEELWRKVKNC